MFWRVNGTEVEALQGMAFLKDRWTVSCWTFPFVSVHHTATAPMSMLSIRPSAATCPLLLVNLVGPVEAAPVAVAHTSIDKEIKRKYTSIYHTVR